MQSRLHLRPLLVHYPLREREMSANKTKIKITSYKVKGYWSAPGLDLRENESAGDETLTRPLSKSQGDELVMRMRAQMMSVGVARVL